MNRQVVILSVMLMVLAQVLCAKVRVHGAFVDHMVVQQNMKIPVWGWANPGEEIRITGSWGVESTSLAGADSTWQTKLKTPKAGGPFSITVKGENTIVIDDVLSGEVWLCTGQSNMDFEMYRFVNDAREKKYQPLVEEIRKEVATAKDPLIRHIEIPRTPSMYSKKKDFKADWRMAVKGEVDTISAIGYYFAKELRKHLNVPIGLIECAWGGARIQPWLSEEVYLEDEEMKDFYLEDRKKLVSLASEMKSPNWSDVNYQNKLAEWKSDKSKHSKPWPTENPETSKQTPATIYNGMVSAIVPFAMKGVLWYQGESNSHFMEEEYEKYFRSLISSWRKEWNQEDLPFYWAQLASYGTTDERSNQGWAMVSDKLRRTLDVKNTGMAVLLDIGETKDVHPHNKMDAGKRLALWALDRDYNVSVPAVSGPLYKSHKVKGDKIVVRFSYAGSGLMIAEKHLTGFPIPVSAPLRWFEIAGKDGNWKPAKARIVTKNTIELSNPDCKEPVSARYAWASDPIGANLYNKEGLPASIFTTKE